MMYYFLLTDVYFQRYNSFHKYAVNRPALSLTLRGVYWKSQPTIRHKEVRGRQIK